MGLFDFFTGEDGGPGGFDPGSFAENLGLPAASSDAGQDLADRLSNQLYGDAAAPDVAPRPASGQTVVPAWYIGAGSGQAPDVAPNLGTQPKLLPPVGGDFSVMGGALVARASAAIGKRLSVKAVVRFILKYGWQVAQAAFQLNPQEQAMLVASDRAKPRRRRGPHLYTVLKRIRAGDRYRKMLARVSAKAGHRSGGSRRRRSNVVPFRRRKAR